MGKIVIYHGSNNIISEPKYGQGKPYNDYGQGFYCTMNLDLAKEWACPDQCDGYANEYLLDLEKLNVLDLSSKSYNILNWMALLLKNRSFYCSNPSAEKAKDYIIHNFSPSLDNVDVIIGYRADDSYFSFAREFLNNSISLSQLQSALKLGKLGIQVVLISPNAFSKLSFVSSYNVEYKTYYTKRKMRDFNARIEYYNIKEQQQIDDLYILDIMRQRILNDDKRIF
jgi:hypothetical protein